MKAPRIFLIHATPVAMAPISEAFASLWPEAIISHLLEDSLSADLSSAGHLSPELKMRFLLLANYAVQAGADAILFTCSAFGEAIDLCKQAIAVPVLKPNEAMIEEALCQSERIAILATFEPSITSMSEEFKRAANTRGQTLVLTSYAAPAALTALHAGDSDQHDRHIQDLAASVPGDETLCFAQFSMTSAAAGATQGGSRTVLTTPSSAVRKLRLILEG